jgi:hypothetical protein
MQAGCSQQTHTCERCVGQPARSRCSMWVSSSTYAATMACWLVCSLHPHGMQALPSICAALHHKVHASATTQSAQAWIGETQSCHHNRYLQHTVYTPHGA